MVVVDTMEGKAHTTQRHWWQHTKALQPMVCTTGGVASRPVRMSTPPHTPCNKQVSEVSAQLAPHPHIAHLLTWFGVDDMDGVAWHGDKEWQPHTVVVVVIDHGTKCVEAQACNHDTPQTPPSNTFDNIVCVLAWCSQGGLVGL